MLWARPLDYALSNLKKQVHAPVRLVLWDGRELALADSTSVTVRLRDAQAMSVFARPSLLSLAEAYIDGRADLEGDMREAIRSAEAITRSRESKLFDRKGPTNSRHSKRVDREAINMRMWSKLLHDSAEAETCSLPPRVGGLLVAESRLPFLQLFRSRSLD